MTTSNNLDQHEKNGIVAVSLKPLHDLGSHSPSSEVTTVLTHSTLDEFRINFELYVSGIIFFYVWLLFLNIMCVKFVHGDASNRSFPFIAVYFMVEIRQNLSVPLLMEVFLLWGYYEQWIVNVVVHVLSGQEDGFLLYLFLRWNDRRTG